MQIVHYTTLHSTLFSNQRFESRGLVPMIRFSHGFVSFTLPSCQSSSLGFTKIWGKKWRFFSASAGAQTQWRRDWEDPCPVTSTRSSRKWRRSKESSKMLLITRKLYIEFFLLKILILVPMLMNRKQVLICGSFKRSSVNYSGSPIEAHV